MNYFKMQFETCLLVFNSHIVLVWVNTLYIYDSTYNVHITSHTTPSNLHIIQREHFTRHPYVYLLYTENISQDTLKSTYYIQRIFYTTPLCLLIIYREHLTRLSKIYLFYSDTISPGILEFARIHRYCSGCTEFPTENPTQ